ncbi:MAG: fimbrillin family protein [Bacteroidia bacterium]|nr:fimbrillin family protein [Bacteroidia bacterium]
MSLEGSCLPAPLYLQEYIEDATAVTKGATVTTSSINIDGKSFLFDGWLESTGRYTSGSDASGVCDPNDETDYHFVDGVTVSHTGGAWTMSASAIWRNKVPTNFWSRYPVSLASGQGTLTVTLPGDTASDDEQKVLSLTYTMPAPGAVSGDTCVDAVAQQDLLFAYNSETWTDERGSNYVDVNFSHALAAVRFVFSDSFDADLSLSKIGINGIYTQGSCTVQGTASNNSVAYLWSSLAAKTTTPYWQTFSKEEITNGTTDANAKTFFIIPQTLSDDATVNVTFIHSDASTEDLSASLGGAAVTWEAGKVYTYKISANSIDYIYDFAVEIDSDTATTRSGDEEPFTSIDGQTVCFDNIFTSGLRHLKVISYKKKYNSDTKEPLAFTVEYSLDNGSTWKAFDADSLGVGGLSANYTGCVDTLLLDFTSVKKKVTPLGPFPFTATVSDQDLSLLDAAGDVIPNGRSTANCYVIHGAGTYKFPAVYGNAIANGMTNTPSYVSPLKAEGKTDNSQLWDFVNGLGAPITSPWVLEDRTDAVSGICADVLWMDAPGLISSVSLEANYISFSTAPVDSLMEGNAVIGLFVDNDSDGVYTYNTDAVLWSWHIWATAKDLSEDNCASIKDNKDNEYHMMPVNVGWASAASLRYDAPKASFLLRFVQAKDRRNAAPQLSCTIQSPQKTISYAGNSPYFQYGRKDPFLPAVVYDDEVHNKPWFTIGDKTGSEVFHREGEPLFPVVSGRYKATGGIYAPSNAIIAASISHPMTFAYNDNFDGTYTNLWDSCNSFNKLSSPKTVYDPTPYGYTLTLEYNNQKIFNVMKNKRDSGTDYQIVDGAVQFTDEDGEFSPSLNFYPTGRRIGKTDNTGETEDVGVRSYVWSCAPLFEDDSNPNSWTDFVFGCSPTTSNATLSYMTQKASGICLRPLHTNPEINAKISISDRIDEDVNVVNLI